jgi:hypothetical protein
MDNSLSHLLETWHQLKAEIEELHRQRKKEGTAEATQKGLELFLEFLFLSNDKPYSALERVSFTDLEYKPVNLTERVDFILNRPGLFPSYIQLCELMVEQEKIFAKKKIKKASSPK